MTKSNNEPNKTQSKKELERIKLTYINCIVCDFKIEILDMSLGRMGKDNYIPSREMWNGGMIEEISAGYGSGHDGDIYYIGICDGCITKKFYDGTLRYKGSYMGSEISEKALKKAEKCRNRRNNLNDLIK